VSKRERDPIEAVFIPAGRPRNLKQALALIVEFPVASIEMSHDYVKLWWQNFKSTP
jgi:hypothetical protein